MDDFLQGTRRARVSCSAHRVKIGSLWRSTCEAIAACLLLLTGLAHAGINTVTAIGLEGAAVRDIEYHPTNSSIIFLATQGGFYRSTNGGASWQLASQDSRHAPFDIAVHPITHRVFVIGRYLRISDDDGATLRLVESFPDIGLYSSHVVISADGSVIYVTTGERIFRSTDNGDTWQERTSSGPVNLGDAYAIVVDPDDPQSLYALRGTTHLFVSHDGAQTWEPIELPVVDPNWPTIVNDIALANTSPKRLWIAASEGAWYTTDAGDNWKKSALFSFPTRLAVDPHDPDSVYIDDFDKITRLYNGGDSWAHSALGAHSGRIRTIAPNPSQVGRILVGGDEGLALTADGGVTWTQPNTGLSSTSVRQIVPVIASNRTYITTDSNGAYYLDAGSVVPVSLNNGPIRDHGLSYELGALSIFAQPMQPDRVFVGLNGGSLLSSVDSGQSWDKNQNWPIGIPNNFTSSPSNPEIILAAATSDVYRSVNGGVTWTLTSGFPTNSMVA
jgi:photosystem II stability/assembly factor-like uncharacterized protein